MSTIVRKELVQSQDRYVELTKDIMWLNLTLLNHSALFTVIRELQFALIQLTSGRRVADGCATFTFGKIVHVYFGS